VISRTEGVAAVARRRRPTWHSLAPTLSPLTVRAVRTGAVPMALAVVTFLVFSPALMNGFVEWDDQVNLTENPEFRGLGKAQLTYFFTTVLMGHYIPLTWLTFGLDYIVWGMNPTGYHLSNLIIYAANTAVLYFVALRLLAKSTTLAGATLRLGAIAATLFFVLHPLRAESVAWVTERRDVLSGFFFLLTILTYLRMADASGTRRRWLLAGAVGCYFLALASKASVMVLPAMLILLDVYPLRRLGGRPREWVSAAARAVWIEKIPFVILGIGGAAVTYYAQNASTFITSLERYPLTARIAMMFYSLWFYASKTLVPQGLSPLYELPAKVDLFHWRFFLPALAVSALTAALVALRRRWPAGLTVWACYAIGLGPVIGIVHSGHQLTNDRYSYLPGFGLALLFGGVAGAVAQAAAAGTIRASVARAAAVVGVVWLAGLSVLTFYQVQVWRDTDTLWRFALEAEPDCSICHGNLGVYLSNKDKGISLGNKVYISLAREHLELTLKLRPDQTKAHLHLGYIFVASGDFPRALEAYTTYLKGYPNDPDGLSNIGATLLNLHRTKDALGYLERALRIKPTHAGANTNLGFAVLELGRPAEAIERFRRAIRLKPEMPQPWAGLVRANLELGQPVAARTAHGILGMLDARLAASIGPRLLTTW